MLKYAADMEFEKAAELSYGKLPELKKQLEMEEEKSNDFV